MHTYTATDIEVLRYEEAGWEWTYVDDFTGGTITTRTNARGQGKFVKIGPQDPPRPPPSNPPRTQQVTPTPPPPTQAAGATPHRKDPKK